MADDTKTRQEVVEEEIADVLDEYGKDGRIQMICEMAKSIATSLAMLVDAGSNSGD